MYHEDHAINNILLTLTNEGSLYEDHKRWARNGTPLERWKTHIRGTWRFHKTRIGEGQMQIAATLLQAYYIKHVAECEATSAPKKTRKMHVEKNFSPLMLKAITTKYHGATNTKGSRISARSDRKTIMRSYDHELSHSCNHRLAACELAAEFKWTGSFVGGSLPTGNGFCFVNMGAIGTDSDALAFRISEVM